jgi:hypothetical protein
MFLFECKCFFIHILISFVSAKHYSGANVNTIAENVQYINVNAFVSLNAAHL